MPDKPVTAEFRVENHPGPLDLEVLEVLETQIRREAVTRSSGDRPICRSISSAASTMACWDAAGCSVRCGVVTAAS